MLTSINGNVRASVVTRRPLGISVTTAGLHVPHVPFQLFQDDLIPGRLHMQRPTLILVLAIMLSVTVIISAAFLYFCEAFDAIKSPTATALQEFSSSSRHVSRFFGGGRLRK